MIQVDEIKDGVFQVVFTGIDLRMMKRTSIRAHVSREAVVKGLLLFCILLYDKVKFVERSQDELDGKDEGMGGR